MLRIHWQHRIVDATATYLARASWDSNLTAQSHYQNFCAAQASGARATEMASLFEDCDRGHDISSTFLGTRDKQGYANTVELTGDYSEAFNYATVEPDPAILPHQRLMAEKICQLASQATSPMEQDRIGYFASFVGFMVPYCDAFEKAHQLNAVLKHAVALRVYGKPRRRHVRKCSSMVFRCGLRWRRWCATPWCSIKPRLLRATTRDSSLPCRINSSASPWSGCDFPSWISA